MNKTIIVCGGSRGIGAATSRMLVKKGFRVICVSRTIGELEGLMGDWAFVECDLSSQESRMEAVSRILMEPNIWGIVNNSSGPATGGFENSSLAEFNQAFEMHLYASINFVHGILPSLKKQRGGRILNIISVTAKVPLENMIVSNTLRGAMLNWSKTLSKELGPFNITVNNILPGYTETSRLVEVLKGNSEKAGLSLDEFSSKIISQIPLGRFGKPDEIAAVACFLLSEDSSFVSGASIPVDGGWTPCP
jgi:3-oxoacyl-[acyl-carrier protein] reductase